MYLSLPSLALNTLFPTDMTNHLCNLFIIRVSKTIPNGFKSISKLFRVCIRIPGGNLKVMLYRIMTRIICVNEFSYYATLKVRPTKSIHIFTFTSAFVNSEMPHESSGKMKLFFKNKVTDSRPIMPPRKTISTDPYSYGRLYMFIDRSGFIMPISKFNRYSIQSGK